MTHKADLSFFDLKRPWSERKDLILAYYLKPYLWKLAKKNRPILLVDGFAGPGRFEDGSDGSPLIICKAARSAKQEGLSVDVRVLCVEINPVLCARLRSHTSEFAGVAIEEAKFQDILPRIEVFARTGTVFLYLDPFTVTGLAWTDLDRVFQFAHADSSIEVLLNFSGAALARVGCAILRINDPPAAEESDTNLLNSQGIDESELSAVLGGDWWKQHIQAKCPFADKVARITEGYCAKLRTRFNEVCWHDIKERSEHVVPKYTLVFGSRHPHALGLMNDAAVKSRGRLAEDEAPRDSLLFEARSEELVPDISKLPAIVLATVKGTVTRHAATTQVIRRDFGRFTGSQIRKAINELVDSGRMKNSTGKSRMNDKVLVWVTPADSR